MLFNSYIFIFVFLPITLVTFFTLTRFRLTKIALTWLTLSSLFFYSYWNIFPTEGQAATPQYLFLIIISLLFNYLMGDWITSAQPKSKLAKRLLFLGVSFNLGLIAYYKYSHFFLSSLNQVFKTDFDIPVMVLPLAISFYTFTQIAYLVDVYRGETQNRRYNLLNYSFFITFFPHLIAGPVVRHNEIIPQLRQLKTFVFSHKNFALGLSLFCLGLAKKVLIADNISPWVAGLFNHAGELTFIEAWVGALSYTFQLYFDFSGYSDMAIGLGWMFNVRFPFNFDSPYKATSISDFWRRWHITLSNFLRDYLYIPLGGSRKGEIRRYVNLMITMLLGGLWHGAGWTFVLWGGLHGLYLSINHAWRKLNINMPKFLAWAITFFAVIVGWVLFRASSLSDGIEILKAMIGLKGIVLPGEAQGKLSFLTQLGIQLKSWNDLALIPTTNGSRLLTLVTLSLLTVVVTCLPNTNQIVQGLKPNWSWAVWLGLVTSLSLLSLNRVSEFLYFQF